METEDEEVMSGWAQGEVAGAGDRKAPGEVSQEP